jgi:phosphoribosylamine---glycine ligase
VPVLMACARGDLSGIELEWHDKAAVCVVMAAGGYPGSYEKGLKIEGLDKAAATCSRT